MPTSAQIPRPARVSLLRSGPVVVMLRAIMRIHTTDMMNNMPRMTAWIFGVALVLSPLSAAAQGVETNPTGVEDLDPDGQATRNESGPAWLGIMMDATEDGVRVRTVVHGSPAAAAGVQHGDLIRTIGGEDIQTPDQLRTRVQRSKPGDTIDIGLVRADDKRDDTIDDKTESKRISARVELVRAPGLEDILDRHYVGRPAPSLQWTPVARPGTQASLDDVDRPMVVEFWATWCTPCKPMGDYLGRLSSDVGSDVAFVAVSAEDLDRLRATGARRNAGGQAYIPLGRVAESVLTDWFIEAYPTVFVVGADGRVAGAFTGLDSRAAIGRLVRELAARQTSQNDTSSDD